jgi:hypothetical protein
VRRGNYNCAFSPVLRGAGNCRQLTAQLFTSGFTFINGRVKLCREIFGAGKLKLDQLRHPCKPWLINFNQDFLNLPYRFRCIRDHKMVRFLDGAY